MTAVPPDSGGGGPEGTMEHATITVGIDIAELEEEQAELLPAREALGYYGGYNIANIYASNTALALNAGSHNSLAAAAAHQYISVYQG
jgi:hypothetical protein